MANYVTISRIGLPEKKCRQLIRSQPLNKPSGEIIALSVERINITIPHCLLIASSVRN